MKQVRVLIGALAFVMAAHATVPAAAQSDVILPPEEPEKLLPDVGNDDSGQYIPPWANPNAPAPEIGVNEDPTPFDPSDVGDNPAFD